MFKIKNKTPIGDKKKLKITSSYFTILLVAILVVANILMVSIGSKVTTKLDLTKGKILDFSDSTYTVLNELDKDVKIYSILKDSDLYYDPMAASAVMEIVKKYDRISDKVTCEEIDPMSNPQFLMSYQKDGQPISDYGVVVEHGDEYRIIYLSEMYTANTSTGYAETIMAEQLLSAAIINVTSGETTNVQVVEGHGEVLSADYITGILTTDNYNITPVNLLAGDIAPETDILIMSMVTADYVAPEIEKVEAFIANGGKLQVLMGADLLDYPVLEEFYRSWGIEFNKGVMAETSGGKYYQSPYVVIPTIESTDITDSIINSKLTMLVPNVAAISVTDLDNIEYKTLLSSSENSFVSTDISNAEYKEGDLRGPFNIAVHATRTNEDGSKSEAIFSGALFSLTYQYMTAGNQNFVSNTMSALSGKDSTMLIAAKDIATSMITIPGWASIVIGVLFTIVIPLALIVFGIVVWFRRRHL